MIDIKDKFNIIELGAGCGLAGFVASFLTTNNVYITDGNEVVLRLLTKNQEYINNPKIIPKTNTAIGFLEIFTISDIYIYKKKIYTIFNLS